MIDLKDFIVVKNGKQGHIKHYRLFCDGCGADRGYGRKRYNANKCQSCIKRNSKTPNNVDLNDYILQDNSAYRYRTSCIQCLKDRGYIYLHRAHLLCHSCSMLKRWRDGGMSNMKAPKRKFEYVKNDHIFNFKSSYELAYAKYLDSKGIEWEYEPVFTLSNGTNILPDFKLQ